MSYEIKMATGGAGSKHYAFCETIEAGREILEVYAANHRFPGEIIDFTIDESSADAAVLCGMTIRTFSIEPAA